MTLTTKMDASINVSLFMFLKLLGKCTNSEQIDSQTPLAGTQTELEQTAVVQRAGGGSALEPIR